MAEVLMQLEAGVTDAAGVAYAARICGRLAEDGLWDGWIEFEPQNGGTTLRTPRETKQPNRMDLEYWATGLTPSYLEGALERARTAAKPEMRPVAVHVEPEYPGPAIMPSPPAAGATSSERAPHAVLDPFEVYSQGDEVLREELSALSEDHLRNIIRAHGLTRDNDVDIHSADRATLVEMIVASVRDRAG